MKTISQTKLARSFFMTNKQLEDTLRKAGVEPSTDIILSGRRFVEWPLRDSLRVLSRWTPELEGSKQPDQSDINRRLNRLLETLEKSI